MSDYKLYYWPIPFRGNFIRMLLTYVEASYEEANFKEVKEIKELHPKDQPTPLMAPPLLYDRKENLYLAQMPAIVLYLAEKHDLLPNDLKLKSLGNKILADCLDILLEITRHHGYQLWTQSTWEYFRNERLVKWLQIFEHTGTNNGLELDQGFVLGTPQPSFADISLYALLGTMIQALSPLEQDIQNFSPTIYNLCTRLGRIQSLSNFMNKQREEMGKLYCGGEIEKSIRYYLEE